MKEFLLPEIASQILVWQVRVQATVINYTNGRISLSLADKSYDWFNKQWTLLNFLTTTNLYYIKDMKFFGERRLILMNNGDLIIYGLPIIFDKLAKQHLIATNVDSIQTNAKNFIAFSGCIMKTFTIDKQYWDTSIPRIKEINYVFAEPMIHCYENSNKITKSGQIFENKLKVLTYNQFSIIDINYNVYNKYLVNLNFKAKYAGNNCYVDLEDYLWYKHEKRTKILNVRAELCGQIRNAVVIVSDFITIVNDDNEFVYNIWVHKISFDEDAFVVIDKYCRVYHFMKGFIGFKKQPELLKF